MSELPLDEAYFEEQQQAFRAVFDRAFIVANTHSDRAVDDRLWAASIAFARLCLLAKSVLLLLETYPQRHSSIDHGAVGLLSRAIIEHAVFISYLTEREFSEMEWLLRKKTLDIHDCCTRIRMFKGLGITSEYKRGKEVLQDLKKQMAANPEFRALPEEARREILSGSRIYIRGMRKAVKAAGWNAELWDAVYTYLSGQSHSAPISFYHYDINEIDYRSTAPAQMGFMAFALEQATQTISRATNDIIRAFAGTDSAPRRPGRQSKRSSGNA